MGAVNFVVGYEYKGENEYMMDVIFSADKEGNLTYQGLKEMGNSDEPYLLVNTEEYFEGASTGVFKEGDVDYVGFNTGEQDVIMGLKIKGSRRNVMYRVNEVAEEEIESSICVRLSIQTEEKEEELLGVKFTVEGTLDLETLYPVELEEGVMKEILDAFWEDILVDAVTLEMAVKGTTPQLVTRKMQNDK